MTENISFEAIPSNALAVSESSMARLESLTSSPRPRRPRESLRAVEVTRMTVETENKIPQLVELKRLLDSLEGVPIPWGLHVHISDVQKDLAKHGY